jgi:hypothetical protein
MTSGKIRDMPQSAAAYPLFFIRINAFSDRVERAEFISFSLRVAGRMHSPQAAI